MASSEKSYRKWDLLHALPTLFAFVAIVFPYIINHPEPILTAINPLAFTHLHVSSKVLSQLLNQHFQQNFYDFVNSYRIEVAKTKILTQNLNIYFYLVPKH